jgi:hypothetical protein
MQFEYRGFNIECAAVPGDGGYAGNASIWRVLTDSDEPFNSGALRAFPTTLQAINYARVWAEMRCDAQLDTARPVAILRKR